MRSVIEEKTSRIIEVIISSVKPVQLMLGKIIGTSLAGITQFVIWVILGGVLMTVASLLLGIDMAEMQTPQQPGMPNMKVIMYIFPFMMIFFFNNYASGLSYYYFISTLFSIVIMLAIKKFFVDEAKLKAKMQAKKATVTSKGPKPKSKFQERLEAMQKAQQDKMKKK